MAWNVPDQPMRAREAVGSHGCRYDALGATLHLYGGAAREGQEQDAARIGAVDDQMCDAVSQRVGLTGASTGNDQQRTRDIRAPARHAMFNGAALLGVEGLQIRSVRHPSRP